MTFDEYLDVTRTFVSLRYPERTLESVRLIFTDGKRMDLILPEQVEDDSADRHPVERAIMAILAGLATDERLSHKELKVKVMKTVKCSEPTFNRYLRRLKNDAVISAQADGYAIETRE